MVSKKKNFKQKRPECPFNTLNNLTLFYTVFLKNAFLHQGRGQKCLPYLNTEPKVMETPNLACGGCSLKFDGLNSFGELLTTARHRCNISLKKAVLPTGVMARK